MARKNRFVTPNTVRLELSDDDWIEIKERLTYGEQQALGNSALVGTRAGGFEVDFARVPQIRMATWITDWSFANADGKSIPVSPAAIANLDPETAEEIISALNDYQAQRDADPKDVKVEKAASSAKS